MKIGVCIKQVPDTAAKISVNGDGSGIVEEGIKFVMSPYDEYAVEEALLTKEKISGSEVVAFSVGPKRVQEALRSALAMGCDQAVHINTEGQDSIDALATAKALASQVTSQGVGLLFTGKQAADHDHAQVSQMLAELLTWPHVTVVSKFELNGETGAKVERDVEGGSKQVWEVEFPAVLAANKGLNEPRYASLKGIMQAKKKPMNEVPVADAVEGPDALNAKVKLENFRVPPARKAGKVFKDDPKAAAKEVARLLREEAKVI